MKRLRNVNSVPAIAILAGMGVSHAARDTAGLWLGGLLLLLGAALLIAGSNE